jgi:hypothetical protein
LHSTPANKTKNFTCPSDATVEHIVIEKKLEQARQRSAKRWVQLVIIVVAAVGLCGLVLIGLSSVDFTSYKNVPTAAAPDKILTELDREKIREEFKELLQHYENELEPLLESANPELWNREAAFVITELKQKVMTDFSGGNYRHALDNLRLLTSRTEQLLKEAKQLYTENLAQSSTFFEKDLYHEAKLHIDQALLVAPQAPAALHMQEQIEKLPVILPLLRAVKAARAENDHDKEADYLRQLLQIAPERGEAAGRLKELIEQTKSKNFAAHIASGFTAIDNSQAKEARYHYQEAKKIDPDRPELAVLANRVASLETSLRVSRAKKAAEQAVRRDDWQQARVNFSRVLSGEPQDTTAIDGLRRADKILQIQAQLQQYVKDPYRLAHPEVHNEAEKTLAQADAVASYSFGIKQQAERLRELIEKINRLIPVTVTSDNQTNVLVRSVGRVGTISQKIIHLKPGSYTFEGVRKGYKSKLVRVIIPYDRNSFSVQVICDEPI